MSTERVLNSGGFPPDATHQQTRVTKGLDAVLRPLADGTSPLSLTGLVLPARHYLAARLGGLTGRAVLYITPGGEQAERAASNISQFITKRPRVLTERHLQGKNAVFDEPRRDAAERVAWLFSAHAGELCVAEVSALLQRTPPAAELLPFATVLSVGAEADRDGLLTLLAQMGYERVPLVDSTGQLSSRGSIVDIFPAGSEHPVRIELLGDEVHSIRHFSTSDQRSLGRVESCTVLPAGEVVITAESRERALGYFRKRAVEAQLTARAKLALLDTIGSGSRPPNVDWLAPAYCVSTGSPLDFLPGDALVVYEDFEACQRALEVSAGSRRSIPTELAKGLKAAPGACELFLGVDELAETSSGFQTVRISEVGLESPVILHTEPIELGPGPAEAAGDHEAESPMARLEGKLGEWGEKRYDTVITARTETEAGKVSSLFADRGIEGTEVELGPLDTGFVFPEEGVVYVTEGDIFGRKKSAPAPEGSVASAFITSFSELRPGDHIVHREVGIGVFRGLSRMRFGGSEGDFIVCEFHGGDRVYVPVQKLKLIQRYIGTGSSPRLDRLGHQGWQRVVKRVRKAVYNIAHELIELYARRMSASGYRFSVGDRYFREFELAFPYEETPHQESAIEDTMRDMESGKPMDRLICGDVGFGKTEVAMRAAFRAVMDGKQVAVLAPTTVLAYQHMTTFSARFAPYPVTVGMLSRFTLPGERKRVLADLPLGKVDIVIGTHMLLGKKVSFKDLGLVVVDEEQRFGVTHKERLREISKGVAVLTLSATPIPRTLQISLTGIRDISVINTPPEGRQAIETSVFRYDPGIIKETIEAELARGGAVFFIHNRIHNIAKYAELIATLVPHARIDITHGRMKEREIEGSMRRFVEGETDVLVTTAIVESGLDIPTANTIIINDAHTFGLADLYQLRGRVGRSSVRARAVLLVPARETLTDEARKRLRAIMELTELGSGFKLALSDMEIRGAGNIFGSQQSGQIADVGLEMYLEMLDEAVRRLKNEQEDTEIEPEVGTSVPAFIPDDYIPEGAERLLFYKKLSSVRTREALAELGEELRDRFGPTPAEAANLLALMELRLVMKKLFVERVEINKKVAVIIFHEKSGLFDRFSPSGRYTMPLGDGEGAPSVIEELDDLATRGLSRTKNPKNKISDG